MSLQYGVPLEVYVNKFSHMRFEPMGHTKNPDIRIAKSIVDYIFRWLGITFLPATAKPTKACTPKKCDRRPEAMMTSAGFHRKKPPMLSAGSPRSVQPQPLNRRRRQNPRRHKPPANGKHGTSNGHGKKTGIVEDNAALLHRAGVAMHIDQNSGVVAREEQFASFQLDAPSCDNCGAITVRNGNCYLCHNCGNSMGCS